MVGRIQERDKLCNLLHPFEEEGVSKKQLASKLTKAARFNPNTVVLQLKEGGRGLKIKRPADPKRKNKK